MADLLRRRFTIRAAVSAAFLLLFVSVSPAQDGLKSDKPGQFDFYVLALTWSPSYCALAKERRPDRLPQPQCGNRPYAFVVHGLWPQNEHGYPSYCQRPAPRVDRALVDSMLDLMPSPQLVFHEWNRHGTCSGMTAKVYFEAVRKARAAVNIPPAYLQLAEPETVAPADVAAAFMQANPGLSAKAFAVACDKKRLTEVRVCLNKDFSFRDCAAMTRRACRRDKVAMPAVRGG